MTYRKVGNRFALGLIFVFILAAILTAGKAWGWL
jgi:hypothetical protein